MSKKGLSQFAVIGLGQFGTALAKRLYEMDKDVLVVDVDENKINMISSLVTHSIVADASDENVLKSIGINNFDVVAVCMGSNMQSSILTTLICKQMGVKYIIAKAQSEKHKNVLEKIGADLVVFPEVDMGRKIASRIMNPNLTDIMELTENFKIIEIVTPSLWKNKSLIDLDLRKNFKVSVILIKRENGEVKMSPGGETILYDNDSVLLCGSSDNIGQITTRFTDIPEENNKNNDK